MRNMSLPIRCCGLLGWKVMTDLFGGVVILNCAKRNSSGMTAGSGRCDGSRGQVVLPGERLDVDRVDAAR